MTDKTQSMRGSGKKKLEILIRQKQRAIKKAFDIGNKLDEHIKKIWGFHYSDIDADNIIDSLDYASGEISIEEFIETMDKGEIDSSRIDIKGTTK